MQVTPINTNQTLFKGKCSKSVNNLIRSRRELAIDHLLDEVNLHEKNLEKSESKLVKINEKACDIAIKLREIMAKFHEDTVLKYTKGFEGEDELRLYNSLINSDISVYGSSGQSVVYKHRIYELSDFDHFIDAMTSGKYRFNFFAEAQKALYDNAIQALELDVARVNDCNLSGYIDRIKKIIQYKSECNIVDENNTEKSLTNIVMKRLKVNKMIADNNNLADKYKNLPIINTYKGGKTKCK